MKGWNNNTVESSWTNDAEPDTWGKKTPLHIFVRHAADGRQKWVDIYMGRHMARQWTGISLAGKEYKGNDRFMDKAWKSIPGGNEMSRERSVLRGRFGTYIKRDWSLDRLCHRICGSKSPKEETLVAFGAASSCSTGFGYASAPQKRFRKRLQLLHKARVTLVGEHLTSQCCLRVASTEEMRTYLRSAFPILRTWLRLHRERSVLRGRFGTYIKRDWSLDRLCHRICGSKSPKEETLVAFGAASSCSTGFGYASAPQKRFRKRLQLLHKARVTLVGEHLTSQCCSRCEGRMACVTKKVVEDDGKVRRKPIHGVMKCPECRNDHGAPLHVHRDINASLNIIKVYLSLARTGRRPRHLSRT